MENNNLDKFESMMKDALNSHQESYAPSSWDALEKRLPKTKTPLFKSPWLWGAAAVIGIALPLSVVLMNKTENTLTDTSKIEDSAYSNEKNEVNSSIEINKTVSSNNNETSDNDQIAEVFNALKTDGNTTPNNSNENSNKGTSSETKNPSPNLIETTPKEIVNPNGNNFSGLNQNGGKGVELTVIKPTADFTISTKEVCEGNQILLTTQKQNDVDYLWSFGDGTYSKDQNPKHIYENAGSYVVSLIVRSSIDNNILTKATDELIVVNPLPKIDFNFELKDNQGIPITSFINLTDKGYKWNWNTGDGNAYTSKDPDHLYYRKGKYNVTLTVENEFGCTKAFTKPVDIKEDYNLLAPNSFTPNGDGINDYFIPEALKVMDVQFTMAIISINEGVIFESNSLSNPWNGNNQRTGTICGEGTYKWVVSFINSKGKTEQFTGAVLLLK